MLFFFFYQNVLLMSICMRCCDKTTARWSCVLACLLLFDTKEKKLTNHRPSYCPTLQDGLMWEFRLKCTWAGVVTRVPSLEDLTVEQRQLASFAVSIYSRWQFYPVLDLILSLPSFVMTRCSRSPSESFALTLLVFIPGVFLCLYICWTVCSIYFLSDFFFLGGGAVWNKLKFHRNTFVVVRVASVAVRMQWNCEGWRTRHW